MLKPFILMLLSRKSLHGYAIIQKIEQHTGFWKPSPGAIYPMLSVMEKEGLIKSRKVGMKIVYSPTTTGRKLAENMHDIRKELRDKGIEIFSSIIKSGDFARMNQRLVNRLYEGKPPFDSVKAANSIWIYVMSYFHTHQGEKRKDVEQLLNEAEVKLKKMLKK